MEQQSLLKRNELEATFGDNHPKTHAKENTLGFFCANVILSPGCVFAKLEIQ